MSADNFYDGPEDEALGRALLASSQLDEPSGSAIQNTALALGLGVATAGALASVPAAGASALGAAALGSGGAVAVAVGSGAAVSGAGVSGAAVSGAAATLTSTAVGCTASALTGAAILKSLSVGIGVSVALLGGIHVVQQQSPSAERAATQSAALAVSTAASPGQVVAEPRAASDTAASDTAASDTVVPSDALGDAQKPPPPQRVTAHGTTAPGPLTPSAGRSSSAGFAGPVASEVAEPQRLPAPAELSSVGALPPIVPEASAPEPSLISKPTPIDSLAKEVALVDALKRAVNSGNAALARQLVSNYFAQTASRELEQEVRKLSRKLEGAR